MDTRSTTCVGYLIILVGAVLSFMAATVPFYMSGYQLLFSVLLTGLLPYLLYGIAVALLRKAIVVLAGFILLILHAGLVINERILQGPHYADGMIYYGPLLFALLLLPLLMLALHQPWGLETDSRPVPATSE